MFRLIDSFLFYIYFLGKSVDYILEINLKIEEKIEIEFSIEKMKKKILAL